MINESASRTKAGARRNVCFPFLFVFFFNFFFVFVCFVSSLQVDRHREDLIGIPIERTGNVIGVKLQ